MRDDRINVLQIVGNARIGGVAACLLNYYRHSDLSGFRFDFVTYAPSSFDEEVWKTDPHARIYYISPFQRNFIKGIFDLEKVCADNDYKIVHSHLTTLSAFALTPAAHSAVPIRICHAHSAFDRYSDHYLFKKMLRPFACDNATHLMACSRYAAENLFGKRAGEAYILPNAIEGSRFYSEEEQYAEYRRELGLEGKVVLFVGRFEYQKDIPLLVRAFATASKKQEMTLVLVGDGKERHTIIEEISSCGIAGKVKIIPPCDPAPWYKAADIFCLPSRYEGLGMVAIEAQAAGLKCLLSVNVPKEADITGKCKFIDGGVEQWAAALLEPAAHSYDTRQCIEKAHYEITQEAHRLTDFYENALRELR